jgi:hypothetical protein
MKKSEKYTPEQMEKFEATRFENSERLKRQKQLTLFCVEKRVTFPLTRPFPYARPFPPARPDQILFLSILRERKSVLISSVLFVLTTNHYQILLSAHPVGTIFVEIMLLDEQPAPSAMMNIPWTVTNLLQRSES